ncbi:VOC family protein [Spelaeicoccus albus]|uniref:Catechol 2,3-dioxygenase-like lactoylglutathione lyase family enzyme n=1 Tax=Spelaeicoccus albus TaxID=1280376 RepID=A0A7Z0D5M7_9MICO|nr:hypothetical protein [Spelaeicoccus albus]NYI69360.1 catechol 2,3-dioxygenase-like lactoylglutathione lyase family enzyme [Spelaeicoccus albus]
MTERAAASDYRVSPYRFTDGPAEMRRFLEAVGLRPVVTKDDFAVLGGAGGIVAVHPLASAETAESVTTSFGLETPDARAAAEDLIRGGLHARWWDEAFGRRAAVLGPGHEIGVREPPDDFYGFSKHSSNDRPGGRSDGGTADGPAVDVVAVVFTPDLDGWQAFFDRLGFSVAATASGWRELRAGAESGVIGLHASETGTEYRCGLSFKTSEPLADFVHRMRAEGYAVTEEPEAQAPHVTVTDPDGELIEIHRR